MADPLSVAGLAAGVVSLGLQVCGGVAAYLDAIKCRAEELESAQRRVRSLQSVIHVIENLAPTLNSRQNLSLEAMRECLQTCVSELQGLDILRLNLSDGLHPNPSLLDRARETGKKLAYSFNRQKLAQLEAKLNQAVTVLNVALQVLNADISSANSNLVASLASKSDSVFSQMLASNLALHESVTRSHRDVSISVKETLVAKTAAISSHVVESNQSVRDGIDTSRDSLAREISSMMQLQSEQFGRMMLESQQAAQRSQADNNAKILERLSLMQSALITQASQVTPPNVALGRIISKPQNLKALCEVYESVQLAPDQAVDCPTVDTRSIAVDFPACPCRLSRRTTRSKFSVFTMDMYSTSTIIARHLPDCSLYGLGDSYEQSYGFTDTRIASFLRRAVGLSFRLTSGAGGLSISPNFTYYPTVDRDKAPCYQIIRRLQYFLKRSFAPASMPAFSFEAFRRRCSARFGVRWLLANKFFCDWHRLVEAATPAIQKVYRDGRASPREVDQDNRNLMHHVVYLHPCIEDPRLRVVNDSVAKLVAAMMGYGVPAHASDTLGFIPIASIPLTSGAGCFTSLRLLAESRPEVLSVPRFFDAMGGFFSLDILRSSPSVAEGAVLNFISFTRHRWSEINLIVQSAYGCGPLSQAVLADDLDKMAELIEAFPSTLEERNVLGQTPLHLTVGNRSSLELLTGSSASGSLIHQVDISAYSALDYALQESRQVCRGRQYEVREAHCVCAASVKILLAADCALPFSSRFFLDKFRRSSLCAIAAISQGLRDRRTRLAQLAVQSFSQADVEAMALDTNSVLDIHTAAVIGELSRRGVDVPTALLLDLSPRPIGYKMPPNSIYHAIESPEHAELFFQDGFTDFDAVNDQGLPPVADCLYRGKTLRYLMWLVQHGAELLRPLRWSVASIGGSRSHNTISAHHVLWKVGSAVSVAVPESEKLDVEAAILLTELAVDVVSIDGCNCICSLGGCTPFTWFSKSLVNDWWDRPKSPPYVVSRFRFCLENLWTDLPLSCHETAIRYFTAKVLGIIHTCCGRDGYLECEYHAADKDITAEDIEDLRQDQAHEISLLEELVEEFEAQVRSMFESGSPDVEAAVGFWQNHWLPRINEELDKLSGAQLSEEQKKGAEALGVVWQGPLLDEEDEEEEDVFRSVEDVVRQIEEIASPSVGCQSSK